MSDGRNWRRVDPAKLATVTDIAYALDVPRSLVYRWIDLPEFPEPIARLGFAGSTRIWLINEVKAWYARRPVRPMPEHGTTKRYQRSCRCEPCRLANTEYHRVWRRARRRAASAGATS